ncbi:unnamed protein product [Arabidopsis halleri]
MFIFSFQYVLTDGFMGFELGLSRVLSHFCFLIIFSDASGSPVNVFGCGYNNGGTFDETGSGIIGPGGRWLSVITNLPAQFVDFEEILLLLVSQVSYHEWHKRHKPRRQLDSFKSKQRLVCDIDSIGR